MILLFCSSDCTYSHGELQLKGDVEKDFFTSVSTFAFAHKSISFLSIKHGKSAFRILSLVFRNCLWDYIRAKFILLSLSRLNLSSKEFFEPG